MIVFIIILFICAFNFYCILMSFKNRNIRYTFKIKNKIHNIIQIYEQLTNDDKLKDYKYLKQMIDNRVLELVNIKDMKNIKQVKVLKNKNSNIENLKYIKQDVLSLAKNKDMEDVSILVINLMESLIEVTEIILRIRKPILYISYNLKKIKQSRNLRSRVENLDSIDNNNKNKNLIDNQYDIEEKEMFKYKLA